MVFIFQDVEDESDDDDDADDDRIPKKKVNTLQADKSQSLTTV